MSTNKTQDITNVILNNIESNDTKPNNINNKDGYYNDDFFGNIKIIIEEPKRVKHPDGYEYESDYQNKIFKLGKNYLFTDVSTSHTIQISIFRIILKNIFKHISVNKDTINKIKEIKQELILKQSKYNNELQEKVNIIDKKYNSLLDNIPTKEIIEELINNKIFSMNQLDNISPNDSSTTESKGKVLTATQLILLKEQFENADDLVKLRKANLI